MSKYVPNQLLAEFRNLIEVWNIRRSNARCESGLLEIEAAIYAFLSKPDVHSNRTVYVRMLLENGPTKPAKKMKFDRASKPKQVRALVKTIVDGSDDKLAYDEMIQRDYVRDAQSSA